MIVPRSALAASLLRSFAIQGSWNYRTLIGCGFAFALLPVLRTIYAERQDEYEAAVQRHTAVFNSHPYLAPMALGAVAVLEADEEAIVVDRFKSAVRGSLGTLGDRIIWAGFRPVCILLALLAFALGAHWAVATFGFLALYNLGHFATRIWAMNFGLHHGKRLGEKLRSAPVERLQHLMHSGGAFVVGALVPLLLAGRPIANEWVPLWVVAGVLGVAAGARFGGAMRTPVTLVLTAITLGGLLLGALQ
ncbi:MAG TPA: PTS system mannose/fructose/sorbose family transporter subunit IID [Longimicrobiales bacterium]|nr:PTS system mannose/fructose/sorbose family transporter subunit IID [Longimicrobiales bacterium]